MSNDTNDTISVPEAARNAGVIVAYVYQMLASGKLKGEKRDGRWIVDRQDFERWKAAHKYYRRRNPAEGQAR
jgi:excisionase family DNA binding protein